MLKVVATTISVILAASRSSRGEEAILVERAKAGDDRAFEQLIQRHKDSVLNLATRVVCDPDAAEDVFQEAVVAAYRQLPRFRGECRFSTWLYRITLNEARGYLRKERRRSAALAKLDECKPEEEGAPHDIHRGALPSGRVEGAEEILGLLEGLPEKERSAIALFYLEDLSVQEVARAMGATKGTVKSWLSRGRGRLRLMALERGLI
jgi:RNA polymerase sigma-70 factor (ECF subfamily)